PCSSASRHLHPSPTRRSSDLVDLAGPPHPFSRGPGPEDGGELLAQLGVAPCVVAVLVARPAFEEVHAAHALAEVAPELLLRGHEDRKSTRLNSSHVKISYAVF